MHKLAFALAAALWVVQSAAAQVFVHDNPVVSYGYSITEGGGWDSCFRQEWSYTFDLDCDGAPDLAVVSECDDCSASGGASGFAIETGRSNLCRVFGRFLLNQSGQVAQFGAGSFVDVSTGSFTPIQNTTLWQAWYWSSLDYWDGPDGWVQIFDQTNTPGDGAIPIGQGSTSLVFTFGNAGQYVGYITIRNEAASCGGLTNPGQLIVERIVWRAHPGSQITVLASDTHPLYDGLIPDCNSNGTPDSCDLGYFGTVSADLNGNLIPDECDIICADFDGNMVVDVSDIIAFLTAWFADDPLATNFGGRIGVQAIFAFLSVWFGGCG